MSRQARVSLGGSPLEEAILLRVEVNQCLNQHWFAELECRDTLDHPIPGEDVLGQPCQISTIDDDGTERLSFAGFVIDVEVRREIWGSQSAVIRAASPSWAIDRSRRNAYFATGALASIADQLAGGLPLTCELASASPLHEHVQYGESNWKFLLRLVDDAGGWVRAGLGSIELRSGFDDSHPLPFRKEGGLLEFFIDGTLPPAKVRAAHYDPASARSRVWDGQARPASFEAGGARMGAAVASGASRQGLAGSTGRSRSASLDTMAERASSEAERAHGAAVFAGGVSRDTGVVAGGALAIEGAASMEEAGGTWYVLQVQHLWTRKEYLNRFTATPWAGWRGWSRPQPRVAPGPQAARVVANHDPENRGRVRVQLYWQGGGPLLWAPVASAHASAGFGLMMTPEIGDEVLVGFLDSDPERPVVLGSVWNGVHAGPRERYESDHKAELAGNHVKRIVTKSGIRIHMVDTPGHESLTVATPRSNRLVMTEHAAETGRPALVLHTEGDIHLQAAGRVHRQALRESHEVAAPATVIPAADHTNSQEDSKQLLSMLPLLTIKPPDRCEQLAQEIDDLINRDKKLFGNSGTHGLKHRFREQIFGKNGPGTSSWDTHEKAIKTQQDGLRQRLTEFRRRNCGDRVRLPDDAAKWGDRTVPQAKEWKGPEKSKYSAQPAEPEAGFKPFDWDYWKKVTGLSGAALIAYLLVSEGSRVVFPPRNLVPVP